MFIFCSFGSLNSFTVRGQASDTAEIVEGEGISFGKENKTCLSGQCPQLISPAVIYGYTLCLWVLTVKGGPGSGSMLSFEHKHIEHEFNDTETLQRLPNFWKLTLKKFWKFIFKRKKSNLNFLHFGNSRFQLHFVGWKNLLGISFLPIQLSYTLAKLLKKGQIGWLCDGNCNLSLCETAT